MHPKSAYCQSSLRAPKRLDNRRGAQRASGTGQRRSHSKHAVSYHVGNVGVAGGVVGTTQAVDVWDVRKLSERVSDVSNSIHDRGSI